MSNLDDKLREILKPWAWDKSYTEETIAQIKQAFIDEGWHFHGAKQDLKDYLRWSKDEAVLHITMTGAEFYDRFEKEIQGISGDTVHKVNIYAAAKRASGLEEDK